MRRGAARRGGMARLRATHDHRQWLAEGHSSFEARFFFSPFFPTGEKRLPQVLDTHYDCTVHTRWEKCQLVAGRVGKGNLPGMTNLVPILPLYPVYYQFYIGPFPPSSPPGTPSGKINRFAPVLNAFYARHPRQPFCARRCFPRLRREGRGRRLQILFQRE